MSLSFSSYSLLLPRTKWKRQTAVGLELLAEAGNYAAVQRMLQTSPYWLSQYGNVAASALAAAAGGGGGGGVGGTMGGPGSGVLGVGTPTTTPFDIYYRQAAAALQQKHQSSAGMTPTGEQQQQGPLPGSLTPSSGGSTGGQMAPMYVSSAPSAARFNPLYLSSLPPSMLTGGGGGGNAGCSPEHQLTPTAAAGLLMPLIKMESGENTSKTGAQLDGNHSKSPSPSVSTSPQMVNQPAGNSSPSPEAGNNSRPHSNSSSSHK